MTLHVEDYDYDKLKDQGTGTHDEPSYHKIVTCTFDKYRIKVKLTPANEFIGITEVKVNKNFLSHKQEVIHQGFHDVDEFYRE